MSTPSSGAPSGVSDLFANLELQIRYAAPSSLVALGRKARTHSKDQIRQIAESIRTFGFTVPVLVDEAGKIIAGNARVEAALHLGLATVPVVEIAHLSPEQKRAFVLAENQLATLAGWDSEVLRLEFEELSGLDLDFDLATTGFLEAQIDAIVFNPPGRTRAAGAEKLPALPLAPTSRPGDLWILGEHRLFCGDSTRPESLQALLGDELARTVFCDIPYNQKIAGHVSGSGKHQEFVMASGEMTDEEFTQFTAKSLQQIEARLVLGGIAYFCIDWPHIANVLDALNTTSLEYKNLVVWDKGARGMGSFLRSQHELIFVFKKPGAPHLNRVELGKHGRDRGNVWSYPGMIGAGAEKVRARERHPTSKPVALVRDALLDSSARGDLVLDLFSGSGTTILAADEAGRRGAAIELDPRYVDTGVIRWQDHTGQEARLFATGQTFREVRAKRAAQDVSSPRSAISSSAPAPSITLPPARSRTRPSL